jgi:hypothetical protein
VFWDSLSLPLAEDAANFKLRHYPLKGSRKMENHAAATALNYFGYNFIKIHRTLRTSPARAAGVTDRLWSVEDLVALWRAYERRRAERAA